MKRYLISTLFLFLVISTFAQKGLAGLWEGQLTYRERTYKFEVLLKVLSNGQLEGITYIYQTDEDVVEAKVNGKIHYDRSINLYDLKVDYVGPSDQIDVFPKNYQLLYKRSLWNSTLDGFWQEQIPYGLDENSKLGKIFLKKSKPKPDKA